MFELLSKELSIKSLLIFNYLWIVKYLWKIDLASQSVQAIEMSI